MDLRHQLQARLQDLEPSPDPEALDRLVLHANQICRWNPSAKLVSRRDVSGPGLLRHYLESLRALPYLESRHLILDIGSGGGFPGLVWAACRPQMGAVLVESSRRKAAFLRHAAHAMGLPQVRVLCGRATSAAEMAGHGADLLTTRAAAAADLVLEAGRHSATRDVRTIIYLGRLDAVRLADAAGFHLAACIDLQPQTGEAEPAGEDEGPGQLLILDHGGADTVVPGPGCD